MRIPRLSVGLAAIALLTGFTTVSSASTARHIDPAAAAANAYLNGLVAHSADKVPLAPALRHVRNGHLLATNPATETLFLSVPRVSSLSYRRVLSSGTQAVAIYDVVAPSGKRTYEATRFEINRARQLVKIQTSAWDPPSDNPVARPFRNSRIGHGPCAANTDRCKIATAKTYLDALLSHDASKVPLARDAWRIENGSNTGDSGPAIREGVAGTQMKVIRRLDQFHYLVSGEQVVVFYRLNADPQGLVDGAPTPPDQTEVHAYIAERFRIQAGVIREIEAIFAIDGPAPTDQA